MPDDTDTHIGARLREVRKRRGLTQRELADASGVSISLIRKLEQAELADTRMETARRLAVALRVPTTQLLNRDTEISPPAPGHGWERMRRALSAPLPRRPLDELPTVSGVAEALATAHRLRASDTIDELATLLPPLIRDADTLSGDDPTARPVRAGVLHLTGWLLTQTRQYEAADTALERAMTEAPDRLEAAATINTRSWLLLRQGDLSGALDVATRWADELEPTRVSRALPAELAAWGSMLLRAAAAAIRDSRPHEAENALRLAETAAAALGRQYDGRLCRLASSPWTFGRVNVLQMQAELEAVADQPEAVLHTSCSIPVTTGAAGRLDRHRHLLDVASAHARLRHRTESVRILYELHEAAPQWLSNQRYAQDTLGTVIGRRRTLTPQMRTLADAIGVPM